MSKKSFNPFKMWGSYVGLVIGSLISGGKYFSYLIEGFIRQNFITKLFGSGVVGLYANIIIFAICGFLIGYGIHALIRGLRK